MGRMKDIFTGYMEEWDNHDCRRNDPDDGCPCGEYENFMAYANARYEEDYGSKAPEVLPERDYMCLNTDEICEDCGIVGCQQDTSYCEGCDFSHCENYCGDYGCINNYDDEDEYDDDEEYNPPTWNALVAMQQDPPDPADPPTWNQITQDPADPADPSPAAVNPDPNDEITVPIDLEELDLEIGPSEPDGFTIREPNELDQLKQGNAGKKAGDACWKCNGTLQQYGGGSPFCGPCELAIEKKK